MSNLEEKIKGIKPKNPNFDLLYLVPVYGVIKFIQKAGEGDYGTENFTLSGKIVYHLLFLYIYNNIMTDLLEEFIQYSAKIIKNYH